MTLLPRRRKHNSGRPPEKGAVGFLQWVRGHECVCAKRGGCSGKVQSAHVDYAGGKGMGTKVADRFSVPLCDGHHREQHNMGWTSFEMKHGINALRIANELWRRWPGCPRWEATRGTSL